MTADGIYFLSSVICQEVWPCQSATPISRTVTIGKTPRRELVFLRLFMGKVVLLMVTIIVG
jgi:hypothetical protein